MRNDFEVILARAKGARRDELRKLFLLAIAVLARQARRLPVPSTAWIPVMERLTPEDRPGC